MAGTRRVGCGQVTALGSFEASAPRLQGRSVCLRQLALLLGAAAHRDRGPCPVYPASLNSWNCVCPVIPLELFSRLPLALPSAA